MLLYWKLNLILNLCFKNERGNLILAQHGNLILAQHGNLVLAQRGNLTLDNKL